MLLGWSSLPNDTPPIYIRAWELEALSQKTGVIWTHAFEPKHCFHLILHNLFDLKEMHLEMLSKQLKLSPQIVEQQSWHISFTIPYVQNLIH